jgi:hypothetical protein
MTQQKPIFTICFVLSLILVVGLPCDLGAQSSSPTTFFVFAQASNAKNLVFVGGTQPTSGGAVTECGYTFNYVTNAVLLTAGACSQGNCALGPTAVLTSQIFKNGTHATLTPVYANCNGGTIFEATTG